MAKRYKKLKYQNDIKKVFGSRVKFLRTQCDVSLDYLAGHLGYSGTSYLRRIEKGQVSVGIEVIEKIAEVFKITIPELMTMTEDDYEKSKFKQY